MLSGHMISSRKRPALLADIQHNGAFTPCQRPVCRPGSGPEPEPPASPACRALALPACEPAPLHLTILPAARITARESPLFLSPGGNGACTMQAAAPADAALRLWAAPGAPDGPPGTPALRPESRLRAVGRLRGAAIAAGGPDSVSFLSPNAGLLCSGVSLQPYRACFALLQELGHHRPLPNLSSWSKMWDNDAYLLCCCQG